MRKFFRDRGFVSLLILLVLVFLSWQGIVVWIKAGANERMARYEAAKTQASFAADGGLEYAKACLRDDPDWPGGSRELAGGRVTVDVRRSDQDYDITSKAEIGSSVQIKHGIYARKEDGNLLLKTYEELYQ
jgi:hypothetical protein